MKDRLDELIERINPDLERREHHIARLNQTLRLYGEEIAHDIKDSQWQSVYQSGLHAGYLHCLLGNTQQGLEMLQKSFALHDSKADYNRDNFLAESLVFILETMDKFGLVEDRSVYQERLDSIRRREKESQSESALRRKIVHLEADMECATGDLDHAYSNGRRKQGLLYQKLGEYDKAIEHFQRAIQEDRRDWGCETSIKNRLSIVDSYLALGQRDNAVKEFIGLMSNLVPDEIKEGDEIPDSFTENFSKFKSYFERLGIEDKSHEYARVRLDRIKPDLKSVERVSGEVRQLSEILLYHYEANEQWNKAIELIDEVEEATQVLEYPVSFSTDRRSQYHINAGRIEEARRLLDGESREEMFSFARDGRGVMEMTSQYLQIGDVDSALDLLDVYCKNDRRSSLWMDAIETRVMQIEILGKLIGDDYVQRLREYVRGRTDLLPKNNLKFLPLEKIKKDKKARPLKEGDEVDLDEL